MSQKPLVDELVYALQRAMPWVAKAHEERPNASTAECLVKASAALARAYANPPKRETGGSVSEITEAERLVFAEAEWFEEDSGSFATDDPKGFTSTYCLVRATKSGRHNWWLVEAYDEDGQRMRSAEVETAAECIQWAADPDSVEASHA